MNDIEKSNSLTDLAARIRTEHETIRRIMADAVKRAMNAGDMLLEAKKQLKEQGQGYGYWMPWLEKHCDMSQRTANLYMRLAKNRKVIEASGDIAGLTLNAAARLLAPPRDVEEKIEAIIHSCEVAISLAPSRSDCEALRGHITQELLEELLDKMQEVIDAWTSALDRIQSLGIKKDMAEEESG
jgi:hypothetical protein